MPPSICTVADCDKGAMARGWCPAHYRRWRKYGDPQATATRKPINATGSDKWCSTCKRMLDTGEFTQGWAPCRDCRRDRHFTQGKTCSVCGCPVANGTASGMCREHFNIHRRENRGESKRRPAAGGYVLLTEHWDHPNARSRGHILEHVKVMSEVLGRPLLPGENVHHINGVRDDNRPENLELWVVKQPQGQRPADLVAWAREILERYAPVSPELPINQMKPTG